MAKVKQIEYQSTLYDIEDAAATTKLEELLSGGDTFKQLGNLFYPVGSIIIRQDTINPATIFGGTWEEVKEGALRVTHNNGDVGKNYGSDTTQLSVAQLPTHNHPFTQPTIRGKYGAIGSSGTNLYSFWHTQSSTDTITFTATGGAVGNRGDGEAISIHQLSIYVKAWVRTSLYSS